MIYETAADYWGQVYVWGSGLELKPSEGCHRLNLNNLSVGKTAQKGV